MAGLVRAYRDGQLDVARKTAHAIHRSCEALLRFGWNPAPAKAAMNRLGVPVGGCRPPLATVDEARTDELLGVLREARAALQAADIPFDATLGRA